MSLPTNLMAIPMLAHELEQVVKREVKEVLVKKFLKEFEVELRDNLNKYVDHLTIGKIETLTDFLHWRDEIHVFVHHTPK